MKRRLLATLVFGLLIGISAHGQQTYKFATRDTLDLYLDVYEPAPEADRYFEGHLKPTVLFVFGGGFVSGTRDGEFQVEWFRKLTEAGYGVVAIDYRLGMKGYKVGKGLKGTLDSSNQFLKAQQMGVEDVFSAISFLAENRSSQRQFS